MTGATDTQRHHARPIPVTPVEGKDWAPSLDDEVIRAYILDQAGELGLHLAELIREHQPILGVDVVELVDDKPSTVRKAMYRLEEARVAEYEKDTDKSGWETFTWRLALNEVKYLINNQRKTRLTHLKERLAFESKTEFYQCENEHPRVDFETSMEIDFRCPTCTEPMNAVDNSENMERLIREIHDIEKAIF